MKVTFKKVKHTWEDGKSGKWSKHDEFDDKIFSHLKQEYARLTKDLDNYLIIEGKTLFLFYRKIKKDFQGRQRTEIVGFLADKRIKKTDFIIDYIKNNIPDPFDNIKEYQIEINDNYIINNQFMKYLIVLLVLFLSIVSLWKYSGDSNKKTNTTSINTPPKIENIDKKSANENSVKSQGFEISTNVKKEELEPELSFVKKKNWNQFCKKYNTVNSPQICYQLYIQQKCKGKTEFIKSYIDYANENTGRGSCESWKNLLDDDDLKNSNIKTTFFKGEKTNEKSSR